MWTKKIKKLFEKDFFWIVLILLFSLLAIYPLFPPGFYTFSDEPHIANLYEMIRAITGGQIPPRWAPDFSFNFGHPFFIFYYPLPFYLGSFFHFLFRTTLIWSLKLVFLLSVLLSGVFFYLLMRKFFERIFSFAGALLYIFTPYRAVDLYVRGAVGEMWGFVFMPLAAFCFVNLIRNKNFFNLSFAALSLAFLILTHNLTPIIFLPFFVIFLGILILQEKEKLVSFFYCLFAGILGLSISSYYWLPAIFEKQFLQKGTPFNPYDHFPFVKQLIFPSWGYGASVWGPTDEISFQIGVMNLLVVFLGFFGFLFFRRFWKKEKIILFFFCLFSFLFSIFMMNIRSWFIWQMIPVGDYIQFPWRFLMITTFSSSLMVGFLGNFGKGKWEKILPLLIIIGAIILTFNYFKPGKQVQVDDDYYLRRFFADRTISGKRSDFSKEYLNNSEDYLPLTIWTEKRPNSLPWQKIEVGEGELSFFEESPTRFRAKVNVPKETKVFFHNYYYPGWQAEIDGKKTKIEIEKPYGDMSVLVPAGEHRIIFSFKETPLRFFSNYLSFFSLFILLAIFFLKRRRGKLKKIFRENWPLFLIFLVVLGIYYPVFSLYFFQDDFFILKMGRADSISSFFEFFSFSNPHGYLFYRPLTTQVYAFLVRSLFGLQPFYFHLVGFIFFLANIFLVSKIVEKLLRKRSLGFLAGFLYGISAANLGNLSYISNFQEIGAAFFLFLSFWFYLEGRKIAILFFIFSLLSKENAIIFPLILAIYELFLGNKRWRRIFPFFVVLIFYSFFRISSGLPNISEYKPVFSPFKILNNYFWYFLWGLGLPEFVVDFVGPGFKIDPRLIIYYRREMQIIFGALLFFALLLTGAIIKSRKEEKLKEAFFLFLFIIGLLPAILWPWHKFSFYLTFPLLGLIGFLIILLNNLPRFLVGIAVFLLFVVSFTTIRLYWRTYWAITRAQISRNLIYDLKEKYPEIPKGAILYFKNDPSYPLILGFGRSSTQAYYVLSGENGPQVIYDDFSLRVYYEDLGEPPEKEEIFPIVARINQR